MSIQTEQVRGVAPAQQAVTARAITFESKDLEILGRQVVGWLAEHPTASFVGFSHAAETRQVVPFSPRLSGAVPTTVHTGILLVQI